MKIKKYFLISILFVFSNIFLFSQTATFGIAYDNFSSPTLGIFGNISSDLAKNTELEARLKYLNENNYEVLITTNFKPLNFFNLITGFDVILEDNILYPGFVFQTNFITKKSSQYRLGVAVGLNPENVLKPNSFTLKTGLFIKKENASMNLDISYTGRVQEKYHKIAIESLFLGFNDIAPFDIGIRFGAKGILNPMSEKRNANFILDFGLESNIKKNNSITSVGIKTRVFSLDKKKSFPISIFISKTVTF